MQSKILCGKERQDLYSLPLVPSSKRKTIKWRHIKKVLKMNFSFLQYFQESISLL